MRKPKKSKPSLTGDARWLMDREQFSAFTGLATGTVSNKIDDATVVCVKRGARKGVKMQIDVARSVKNLLSERAKRPDSARLTVASEQAERLRLANAKSRRELIPIGEVQIIEQAIAAELIEGLNSFPQRLSSDEALQKKARDECNALRDRIASRLGSLAPDAEAVPIAGGNSSRTA